MSLRMGNAASKGTRARVGTLLLAALSVPALGQSGTDVFVTTGEHGELSFSDVAVPGAERVVVETGAPLEDPLAELDRRIERTLSVANDLEASRLARERARAEAHAAARLQAERQPAPQVVYQDRYVNPPYLWPSTGHRGVRSGPRHGLPRNPHGHDGRAPREPPAAEEPPRSRAFLPPD